MNNPVRCSKWQECGKKCGHEVGHRWNSDCPGGSMVCIQGSVVDSSARCLPVSETQKPESEDDLLTLEEMARCIMTSVNLERNFVRSLCEAQSAKTRRRMIEQGWRYTTARVIVLCGSTRFTEQMLIKQWELTKQGHVVMSWCALPDSYFKSQDKTHIGDQEGVKVIVDEVHKRKIDLADEILVLNVGGYIGESTRSEIEYAEKHGKTVRYLEDGWRKP